MSIIYRTKPGEKIQQGLYSFDRTDTLVLVEDRGKSSYSIYFFPNSKPIPHSGLAQRLTPLSDPRKITILIDSEIPIWLANQTRGNRDLGKAVEKALDL